jgi:hypothetical protein
MQHNSTEKNLHTETELCPLSLKTLPAYEFHGVKFWMHSKSFSALTQSQISSIVVIYP